MEPVPGIIRKSMSMSPFDGIAVVIQKWGQKPIVISVVWGAVMRTWNYLSPDTETNSRFMLAWYVIPSFHRPSYINIQMDMQQVGTISQAMIQRRTQKPRSLRFRSFLLRRFRKSPKAGGARLVRSGSQHWWSQIVPRAKSCWMTPEKCHFIHERWR